MLLPRKSANCRAAVSAPGGWASSPCLEASVMLEPIDNPALCRSWLVQATGMRDAKPPGIRLESDDRRRSVDPLQGTEQVHRGQAYVVSSVIFLT